VKEKGFAGEEVTENREILSLGTQK